MNPKTELGPLVFLLNLTEDQRRQIQEQSGRSISALPYESAAPSLRCHFGGNMLRVARGVFVPAAVTERLLERARGAAVDHVHPVIVDVGTGCGAVALALAKALPNALLYATDVSDIALRCARGNRARLGLRKVHFRRGSLLSPLPDKLRGGVAVIVANVPYVPPEHSEASAKLFPPGSAIGTGADGLDLVRELTATAREFLVPGGSLVLQLASYQWTSFAMELTKLGYNEPEVLSQSEIAPVAGRITWPGRNSGA